MSVLHHSVLAEAEERKQQKAASGAGATSALEKKKRREKATDGNAPKHPKLLDSIFGSEPLQSKGDSEDDMKEEEHHEEPPRQSSTVPTPIAVAPIAVRRAPVLEYSAMAEESDEHEGHNASPIQVESRPPTTTPDVPPTGAAAEANVRCDTPGVSTLKYRSLHPIKT